MQNDFNILNPKALWQEIKDIFNLIISPQFDNLNSRWSDNFTERFFKIFSIGIACFIVSITNNATFSNFNIFNPLLDNTIIFPLYVLLAIYLTDNLIQLFLKKFEAKNLSLNKTRDIMVNFLCIMPLIKIQIPLESNLYKLNLLVGLYFFWWAYRFMKVTLLQILECNPKKIHRFLIITTIILVIIFLSLGIWLHHVRFMNNAYST
jgi:hypothetical protein